MLVTECLYGLISQHLHGLDLCPPLVMDDPGSLGHLLANPMNLKPLAGQQNGTLFTIDKLILSVSGSHILAAFIGMIQASLHIRVEILLVAAATRQAIHIKGFRRTHVVLWGVDAVVVEVALGGQHRSLRASAALYCCRPLTVGGSVEYQRRECDLATVAGLAELAAFGLGAHCLAAAHQSNVLLLIL
jgi:hypothetical protein